MEEVISQTSGDALIRDNTFVIIRKDAMMKLHQVKRGRSVRFGKQTVFLNGVIGLPFGTLFEIQGNRLRRVELATTSTEDNDDSKIGDNRHLNDDGKSQKLTKDDIEALKEQGLTGEEIVQQLVDNSATFKEKNKFSQVKYMKKKKAKYTNIVEILQPTTRLIAEMYYGQGPIKIINLRMDSLAQMLSACNVHSGARYLVMDSCLGLVTGAVMERLAGHGSVVRCYTGDAPVSNAIQAYNFTEAELGCLHNIKYTALLQSDDDRSEPSDDVSNAVVEDRNGRNEEIEEEEKSEQQWKGKRKFEEDDSEKVLRRQQREKERVSSLQILSTKKMDGLLIASKYDPVSVLPALLPYLQLSRPFVVFCPYKQPLIDCYCKLKEEGNCVMLHLGETWCRYYQVLPKRTHPEVNMSGNGGYILTGLTAVTKPET